MLFFINIRLLHFEYIIFMYQHKLLVLPINLSYSNIQSYTNMYFTYITYSRREILITGQFGEVLLFCNLYVVSRERRTGPGYSREDEGNLDLHNTVSQPASAHQREKEKESERYCWRWSLVSPSYRKGDRLQTEPRVS